MNPSSGNLQGQSLVKYLTPFPDNFYFQQVGNEKSKKLREKEHRPPPPLPKEPTRDFSLPRVFFHFSRWDPGRGGEEARAFTFGREQGGKGIYGVWREENNSVAT